MGRLVGVFKFVGKVGNKVGYYVGKDHRVRTIGKLDLDKMRSAPQYAETRKNQSEFAVATKAGQLFRHGIMDITKGYTDGNYPVEVMKIMIKTLRSDTTQPKGQKLISNGLKNAEAQRDFTNLTMFSKRECLRYRGSLVKHSPDQKAWRLNRNILFGKGVNGDQMSVKIGYYHIDFEARVANYEDMLSIACHRNEKIEYTDFTLPKPNKISTPWTFVIMQVWREGNKQDISGMTFLSVLDIMDNQAEIIKPEEPQKMYRCGLEIEEENVQHSFNNIGKQGLNNDKLKVVNVDNAYSKQRAALVQLGIHDWDEAVKKAIAIDNKKKV